MKELYVILDGYFSRTNGKPSSNHLSYENFGKRYASTFDRVTILSRIGDREDKQGFPLEGQGVDVLALPDIRRMGPFLLYIPKLLMLFWRLPREASYILRIPGFITSLAWLVLWLRQIPFAVELVGDPADVMGPKAFRHPLRPALAWFLVKTTKIQCTTAAVTAFVTAKALQKRYPPARNKPTFHYTSLDLRDGDYVSEPRPAQGFNVDHPTLINVAMMNKTIKGQDTLLHAFAGLRAQGIDARLVLIGDGDCRHEFEKLAVTLNIEKHVIFTGLMAKGPELLKRLDSADLFVLPSRQEGLPRAIIEAMARALPCIASDVGGTSELLQPEYLVKPDDIKALQDRLANFLSKPQIMAEQSARNLQEAQLYHVTDVSRRRLNFFQTVKDSR